MAHNEAQGEEKCLSLVLIKDILSLKEGISRALFGIVAIYYAKVYFELLKKIVQNGISLDIISKIIMEVRNLILIVVSIIFLTVLIRCFMIKIIRKNFIYRAVVAIYLHFYYDFKIKLLSYLINKINTLSNDVRQSQWESLRYLKMFVLTLLARLIGLGESEFIREAAIYIEETKKFKEKYSSNVKKYLPTVPMSSEAVGKPLLVKTNHLKYGFYWKPFDYTISLLYDGAQLLNMISNKDKERRRIILEVNLCQEKNGLLSIYNNAGKVFIYEHYVKRCLESRDCKKKLERLASEIHNRIRKPITWKGIYKFPKESLPLPLRWASGGVLPIAYYKENFWFVLFYRNFSPMCWNLPLGASETFSEQEKVDIMSTRESMEEILLVDNEPDRGSTLTLKPIFPRTSLEFRYINEYIWPKVYSYLKEYAKLRHQQDGFSIKIPEDLGGISTPAGEISTPYDVKIKYRSKKESMIQNVLFIINPEELGIEIIRPFIFLMNDEDYILWGEIWKGASAIPRTPVLLLSVDYVQNIIKKGGKFGDKLKGNYKRCSGCRSIIKIPKEKYVLFYKDILFAKERLENLKRLPNPSYKEKLEIKSLRWHSSYSKQIDSLINSARKGGDLTLREHSIFMNFCPTTWRSFEILYTIERLDKNFLDNMLKIWFLERFH